MIEGISYQISDCPVLIVETLDIRESISVHRRFQVYSGSDFQVAIMLFVSNLDSETDYPRRSLEKHILQDLSKLSFKFINVNASRIWRTNQSTNCCIIEGNICKILAAYLKEITILVVECLIVREGLQLWLLQDLPRLSSKLNPTNHQFHE